MRAGSRRTLRIEYEGDGPGLPTAVRVTAAGDAPASDIRLALSQVDVNGALGPEVFRVKIPSDAQPISLDELRQAGPMGEKR